MGIILTLIAALFFGLAQYLNGRASRTTSPLRVACWTQLGFLLAGAAASLAQPISEPWRLTTVGWGVAAGLGGAWGALCLYAALARSTFTLAVGTSTVTTTAAPALVAMILLGEQFSPPRLALLGLAVVTVWLLVSQRRTTDPSAALCSPGFPPAPTLGSPRSRGAPSFPLGAFPLALLAGLGFALELVAVSRMPGNNLAQGLWIWGLTSWAVLLGLMLAQRREGLLPRGRTGLAVVTAGVLTGTAMWCFHLSAVEIGLATTSALVAIYPAVPILLAIMLLRERPGRRARWGLLCAGGVIALGGVSTLLHG